MTNAILLHGKPSKERFADPAQPNPQDANWFPWLAHELTAWWGMPTVIPVFPKPYDPDYNIWQQQF